MKIMQATTKAIEAERRFPHRFRAIVFFLGCLLLAACGGGGDGGNDPIPPPPPPPNNCSNNNTSGCATFLGGNNAATSGMANSSNDPRDYYLYRPSLSGPATITLSGYGSNDLDLEIRSASDLVLKSSRSATAPQEQVVQTVTGGSRYYIVVVAYSTGGLDSTYDLAVTLNNTPTTSSMNFSITDACNDGKNVRFKFYDVDNNRLWPTSSTHYTTTGLGNTQTRALACTSGAKICYGASTQSDGGGLQWGIGLFGDGSCTNCCYQCTHGASVGKRLVCN